MNLSWPRTSEGIVPRWVLLLGSTQSGKSTAAPYFARMMCTDPARIRVVGIVPKIADALGVPFHPIDPYDRDRVEEFFEKLEKSSEGIFLVLDEADEYMSARAYSVPALFTLVNAGANFGKGGILIGHGSNVMPKNMLANAGMICYFATNETNLIRYARDLMPDYPGGPDSVERTLRDLPPHMFLLYTPRDTPHYPGFGKVVEGKLLVYPMSDHLPESDDAASDVNTPDAGDGSSPGTGPDSAPSTIRPGGGPETRSPGPRSNPADPITSPDI